MAGERTLPGIGLTAYWDLGSPYKAGMDTNLRLLSAVVQGSVLSRTTSIPGTGNTGDIYIVPAGAPSNANDLAIWDGEAGSETWVYVTPGTGWRFYVEDEPANVQFDGSAWVEFAAGGGGGAEGATQVREEIETIDLAALSANEAVIAVSGADDVEVNVSGMTNNLADPYSRLQVSTDDAATWLATSGDYQAVALSEGFGDGSNRTNFQAVGSTSAEPASTLARFYGLQRAADKPVDILQYVGDAWFFSGVVASPDPITHIRFYSDNGEVFTGGTITVVRKFYEKTNAGTGQSYPLGFASATPPTGTWTLDNEEPAEGVTETSYVDGGTVEMKVQGSNEHWVYHTPLAGAGTFDVVGRIGYSVPSDDFAAAGMVVGTGTNYLQIGVHWDNTFVVKKHSGHVFDSESFYSPFAPALAGNLYYRAVGDGTDVTLYVSEDGLNWTSVFTEPFTTFLGGAPDVCGVWIDTAAVTATEVVTVTCRGLDFDGPQPEAAARDGIAVAIREATGTTYAATDADLAGNVIRKLTDAAAITVDVPPGLTGTEPCTFVQTGAGQITFAPGAGVTINSADGALTTRVQYSNAVLIPDGVDTFLLVGDITT